MPRLGLLDVSWNRLFYLPAGIFAGIHHLRRLNLANCSLHAMSVSLSLPRLEELDLSGNLLQVSSDGIAIACDRH